MRGTEGGMEGLEEVGQGGTVAEGSQFVNKRKVTLQVSDSVSSWLQEEEEEEDWRAESQEEVKDRKVQKEKEE